MKAVAELFHLLPVDFLFSCKLGTQYFLAIPPKSSARVFLPEAVGRGRLPTPRRQALFRQAMLLRNSALPPRVVWRISYFFWTAMRWYSSKTGNVGLVLLRAKKCLLYDKILGWQPFSSCRHFSTLLCVLLVGQLTNAM